MRDGASVAPSRTAAIGGTFVALRAGEIVASIVIPTPISSDTITVRVCEHRALRRQVHSDRLEEGVQPLGEQEAAEQPDDRRHEAGDEALEQHRAPAPACATRPACAGWRARARAGRRVIESVLKMTNEPTMSEIAANASRKYLMIASPSFVSLESASALLGAGPHDGGASQQRLAPASATALVLDAALRGDEDRVDLVPACPAWTAPSARRRRRTSRRRSSRPSRTSRCRRC